MKYTPDASGKFAGQSAYGYRSIADFVKAAASVNSGDMTSADWNEGLASAAATAPVTAVLEAGRLSLDRGSIPISIHYDSSSKIASGVPTSVGA